jgi:hypothetical protein
LEDQDQEHNAHITPLGRVSFGRRLGVSFRCRLTANAGKGIYDPVKWAVVFKYTSVNIPTGVTVTFKNHPSHAPVVWLVQGDATIAGTLNLNGKSGALSGILTEAGPGGFQGGGGYSPSRPVGSGHGPGGGGQPASGLFDANGGSYATQGGGDGVPGPIYGNPAILPLIGGSGGTGYGNQRDAYRIAGSSGGGALLLCAGDILDVSGTVSATGGLSMTGCGSGGAIRIIANVVSGNGVLNAEGTPADGQTWGGFGRIRIEANAVTFTGVRYPAPSVYAPLFTDPVIWPPANTPAIAIAQIAGGSAPVDPHAVLSTSDHYTTLDVSPTAAFVVRLNATNVPPDWNVILRVVPYYGKDFIAAAHLVSGDETASVWQATITSPVGVSAIQARASKT